MRRPDPPFFNPIEVNTFSFLIRAKDDLRLPPYKGSTLRGAFGWAFKSVCCSDARVKCEDCMVAETCVYSYVFETSPKRDSEMMKLYPSVPHPFVIEPPLSRQEIFASGQELQLGLVLVGRAREYLPYFVLAFREMGEVGLGKGRGKYELLRIESSDNGRTVRIYEQSSPEIGECSEGIRAVPEDIPFKAEELVLEFHTPTRLIYEGKLSPNPEFHVLMRSLLRRISAIAYFHCGTTLDVDFKALVERSRQVKLVRADVRWHDWERYSNRQKQRMKLGGFLGTARYSGPWREFWPFLKLGEILHIGKGATFGLGKYTFESRQSSQGQR